MHAVKPDRWIVETRRPDGTVYVRTSWPSRALAQGNVHVMRSRGWEDQGFTLHVIDGVDLPARDRKTILPVSWVQRAAAYAAAKRRRRR